MAQVLGDVSDDQTSHDLTQAEATLAALCVPRRRGCPGTRPGGLAADKGYDSRPFRRYLRRRGIQYSIPEPRDRGLETPTLLVADGNLYQAADQRGKTVQNGTSATALIGKVLTVAEKRFRKLNAPMLAGMVYRGARFADGELVMNNGEPRVAA